MNKILIDEATVKLALEALEDLGMKHFESTGEVLYKETFTVIKEALEQPEQEQLMSDQINYGMSVTQGGKRIDPMSIYKEPEQKPVAEVDDWIQGRPRHQGEHMSKDAMKLEKIMEQAQVFASAWSLVGGRFDNGNMLNEAEAAKKELRQMVAEALAEQPAQQESVGYVAENGVVDWNICAPPIMTDLYTSPPQRKPLTDEEIGKAWSVADGEHNASASVKRRITRAIEAKLKEKNT